MIFLPYDLCTYINWVVRQKNHFCVSTDLMQIRISFFSSDSGHPREATSYPVYEGGRFDHGGFRGRPRFDHFAGRGGGRWVGLLRVGPQVEAGVMTTSFGYHKKLSCLPTWLSQKWADLIWIFLALSIFLGYFLAPKVPRQYLVATQIGYVVSSAKVVELEVGLPTLFCWLKVYS
jgi:hypothetical protein